jgi:hypothetical protein
MTKKVIAMAVVEVSESLVITFSRLNPLLARALFTFNMVTITFI